MENLRDKTLIMLISPSCMGKSTIASAAASNNQFGRAKGFTTREPRNNDTPDQFFYFSPEQLAEKRNAGEVLTEITYPTTGQTYGTIHESFNSEYCLLETLSNAVQTYRDLPFRRTFALSITSPAELWRQRFVERYPVPSIEAKERLEEARLSMLWSLAQVSDHYWLINDASVSEVADDLVTISLGKSKGRDGKILARECLDMTRSMWSQ